MADLEDPERFFAYGNERKTNAANLTRCEYNTRYIYAPYVKLMRAADFFRLLSRFRNDLEGTRIFGAVSRTRYEVLLFQDYNG